MLTVGGYISITTWWKSGLFWFDVVDKLGVEAEMVEAWLVNEYQCRIGRKQVVERWRE